MESITVVAPDGTALADANGVKVVLTGGAGGASTPNVNQRRTTFIDDQMLTAPGQATTATLSNVAANAGSVTIKAANANVVGTSTGRMGLIVVNDSTTATLYLAYAATASTTAYTYKLLPGQTWEMPSPLYSGLVSGIWDVASGNARVTELTA